MTRACYGVAFIVDADVPWSLSADSILDNSGKVGYRSGTTVLAVFLDLLDYFLDGTAVRSELGVIGIYPPVPARWRHVSLSYPETHGPMMLL